MNALQEGLPPAGMFPSPPQRSLMEERPPPTPPPPGMMLQNGTPQPPGFMAPQSQSLFPTNEAPVTPNRTLYVNNLNSKIKTDRLKKELRAMFENFGEVRDVIAMKSFWRRGQAWVIFATQEAADQALNSLQGFPYNNKEMRIRYAHEISDLFTKEDGTFVERPPGPKKPRAIVDRERQLQSQLQQFQQMMSQHMQQSGQPLTLLPMGQGLPTMQNQGLAPPSLPGSGMPGLSTQGIGGQAMPSGPSQGMGGQLLPGQTIPGMAAPSPPLTQGLVGTGQPSQIPPAPPGQPQAHQQGSGSLQLQPNQPPPPLGGPFPSAGPPGSSKESVAAAAAAAAQLVEAAVKKRAADAASPLHKMPRTVGAVDGFNRPGFSAPMTGFYGGMGAPPMGPPTGAPALPNQTLFVENLPEDCNQKMLANVFQQYPGCKDIRHVESRKVAFVDYETIPQASVALRYLNGFLIKEGYSIRVSYAK